MKLRIQNSFGIWQSDAITKFILAVTLVFSVVLGETNNRANFGIIIGYSVNVRYGPSLSSGIKSQLTKYNLVKVISVDEEWALIEFCATTYEPNNIATGYVYRNLLAVFDSPKDIIPFFDMRWRETHYDIFPLFFVYAPRMIPINLKRYPYRTVEHGMTIDTLELLYGNRIIGEFPVDIHVGRIDYNYRYHGRADYDDLKFYAPTDTLPSIVCCPKGRSKRTRNKERIIINHEKLKEILISQANAIFRENNVADTLLQKTRLLNYLPTDYNNDTVVDIMGSAFTDQDFDHKYILNLMLVSDNDTYTIPYHSYLATTDYRYSWHLEFLGVFDFFEDETPELIAFWYGCDAFGYVVLEFCDGKWEMVFVKYDIA